MTKVQSIVVDYRCKTRKKTLSLVQNLLEKLEQEHQSTEEQAQQSKPAKQELKAAGLYCTTDSKLFHPNLCSVHMQGHVLLHTSCGLRPISLRTLRKNVGEGFPITSAFKSQAY